MQYLTHAEPQGSNASGASLPYAALRPSKGGFHPVLKTAAQLLLLVTLAGAFASAQAQTAQDQAHGAAITDGLSTVAGLAAGAAETNPIGAIATIGLKPLMLHYAASLPDTDQPAAYAAQASVWAGATANNVCITAAILSGGSFTPVCLALGVAWGYNTWKSTEYERTFWEGCAMLRQYANEQNLKCIYTPPANTQTAASEPVMTAVSGTPWLQEAP
jgi:hypothetical protein